MAEGPHENASSHARVVLENKAYGLPVIQWREGRGVVKVPAELLEPFARRILETNGDPLTEEEERAPRQKTRGALSRP